MNTDQLSLINKIITSTEEQSFPFWLESGWAIDARLSKVTREHDDIDLAYPMERHDQLLFILQTLGSGPIEKTDYGFLVYIGNILVDCEPCKLQGKNYEIEGTPIGSCPWEKQGIIDGIAVRCTSWEAIIWEYFYYIDEVPQTSWRKKDFDSYNITCQALGGDKVEKLRLAFKNRKNK